MADVNSQLASLALAEVGEEPLTAMSDAGNAAQVARLVLPEARDEIFDMPINWKYFSSRAELSQLTASPGFGYEYQYKLPDSCRRILAFVDENGDEIEYPYKREIYVSGETKVPVLLCNQDQCRIRYIVYITNPGLWPGYFKRLVILKTAIYLAKPLTRDNRMKLNLQYDFKDAYNKAKAANAMEDSCVDDFNVNEDLGNTDVLQAASRIKTNRAYTNIYPGW